MNPNQYVVIMAGGIGSRFWPASRNTNPKQFHDLLGTGRTLLQSTWDRFQRFMPEKNIYVVTHVSYLDLVRKQLPALRPENLLLEPSQRNTAPCIAYATHAIMHTNPRAQVVVSPADHLILDSQAFANDTLRSLQFVEKHSVVVTLGITPTRPDTGYGYIQYLEEATDMPALFRVKTFTEKPSQEIALRFLESGDFLWNSGLFIFSGQTMLDALAEHMPDLNELFAKYDSVVGTKKEAAFINNVYSKCKNTSIDLGIMEKADNVFVIKSEFGWSDLGTWNSVYQQLPKDTNQNVVMGNATIYRAWGNMVRSQPGKMIVLNSVKDLIVVDMEDVLLICDRNDEQYIREIVADLKKRQGEKYL